MRLWTVTVGKLSVDIHLACTCICVYVHADLSYAKLLVCCADSLFGLDVRRDWCVVLSSLQVPPHFFTHCVSGMYT